jgi:hypothetical protein
MYLKKEGLHHGFDLHHQATQVLYTQREAKWRRVRASWGSLPRVILAQLSTCQPDLQALSPA